MSASRVFDTNRHNNMHALKLVLTVVVALSGFAGVSPANAAASRRPNVLFLLTDDQRWDAIGLGGNKHLKTPNMDRLGKEGVYFKNAFP